MESSILLGLRDYYANREPRAVSFEEKAWQLGWISYLATMSSCSIPEEGLQELSCVFSADSPPPRFLSIVEGKAYSEN